MFLSSLFLLLLHENSVATRRRKRTLSEPSSSGHPARRPLPSKAGDERGVPPSEFHTRDTAEPTAMPGTSWTGRKPTAAPARQPGRPPCCRLPKTGTCRTRTTPQAAAHYVPEFAGRCRPRHARRQHHVDTPSEFSRQDLSTLPQRSGQTSLHTSRMSRVGQRTRAPPLTTPPFTSLFGMSPRRLGRRSASRRRRCTRRSAEHAGTPPRMWRRGAAGPCWPTPSSTWWWPGRSN